MQRHWRQIARRRRRIHLMKEKYDKLDEEGKRAKQSGAEQRKVEYDQIQFYEEGEERVSK